MLLSERVYYGCHIQNDSEYSNGSASNFAWSLNIPLQKLFRWFRSPQQKQTGSKSALKKLLGWFGRPQLWATGDWQLYHSNAPTHTSGLVQSHLAKYQITQVSQSPYNPDLVPYDFWLFPKLKPPLKGKRFQTFDEIQENTMGQLMAVGRIVWGPKVPTLKGIELSLSYVQCFLYLVYSSIKVSIFHNTWLDTFWTDLI